MCGIFGQISKKKINKQNFEKLVKHSEQRGIDSSGLVYYENLKYKISRADYNIEKLLKNGKLDDIDWPIELTDENKQEFINTQMFFKRVLKAIQLS